MKSKVSSRVIALLFSQIRDAKPFVRCQTASRSVTSTITHCGCPAEMASPSTVTSLPACFLPPFPLPLEAPVALDGVDISLATEVLPAPPPLFVPNSKRPSDYLRKKVLPSYLPSTDPGSTYNAGTGVIVVEDASVEEETADQGSKRKRQRTEKGENR